jgi:helix-turn-helix protein
MARNVQHIHSQVKDKCVQRAMEPLDAAVHNPHMAAPARKLASPTTRTYLRDWRVHRGMVLERVARQLGITHGQLSRIERGRSPYTQYHLESLAAIYGTSIWSLLYCPPGLSTEEIIARFLRSIGR